MFYNKVYITYGKENDFPNPKDIIFIARRIKLNSEEFFAFEKLITQSAKLCPSLKHLIKYKENSIY